MGRPLIHRSPMPGLGLSMGITLAMLSIVVLLPIGALFLQGAGYGLGNIWATVNRERVWAALLLSFRLSLLAALFNLVFGVLLAWCVTRYDFRGRRLLVALVDIPYATSPVVAGLCYLVVYGLEGIFGRWLSGHGVQLMFAWPGILMVTVFVTSPFVARILIPLMQAQGQEEELAALTLGAGGWQIFRRVTLPNIKWGLLYGAVITNARAVGEFGAVSVVAGAIRGKTLTLPLLIEQLNDDYKTVAAFTAAALLACMALLTLVVKTVMERRRTIFTQT